MIHLQKQTIDIQNREIEKALEELEKTSSDVYKSVGPILVKTEKNSLKKELEETKEENDMKISALGRQEAKIREKITEGQQKFQQMLPEQEKGVGG